MDGGGKTSFPGLLQPPGIGGPEGKREEQGDATHSASQGGGFFQKPGTRSVTAYR